MFIIYCINIFFSDLDSSSLHLGQSEKSFTKSKLPQPKSRLSTSKRMSVQSNPPKSSNNNPPKEEPYRTQNSRQQLSSQNKPTVSVPKETTYKYPEFVNKKVAKPGSDDVESLSVGNILAAALGGGMMLGAGFNDPDASVHEIQLDDEELEQFNEEFSDVGDFDNTVTDDDPSRLSDAGELIPRFRLDADLFENSQNIKNPFDNSAYSDRPCDFGIGVESRSSSSYTDLMAEGCPWQGQEDSLYSDRASISNPTTEREENQGEGQEENGQLGKKEQFYLKGYRNGICFISFLII
jgi:hypothetical protein